jgi:hypothetical protein
LYQRPGSRVKTTRKLSRLKKPDNGKRTSEACKKQAKRRRKENGIATDTEKDWNKDINNKDINSREPTVRAVIPASNRGLSR